MVYDDDTGKPPNFEVEPGGPGEVSPPTAAQRRIVELANQHRDWGPVELARHMSETTNENYTADAITYVLQDARRRGRDRG